MIKRYFLPSPSKWPIIGSCGLFLILTGVINLLHQNWYGHYLFMAGAILLAYTLSGWFNTVIVESRRGLHNQQVDRTYRYGMFWFITSEIAFFGIFFFALFYARHVAVAILGGDVNNNFTHSELWPQFKAIWPLLSNPNPDLFKGPKAVIPAWGLPAFNTLLLLSSAAAVTWAQWGLQKNRRWQINLGLSLTILLGVLFLSCQAFEYHEAYYELNLTLNSGIYGTTFFMLTGFHAAHVTVGLLMLVVILIRCLKGHFTAKHHFGFEAVSWYWHFVDVVWLFLFVFVYWL
ncbi:MAG TPA: cytochrome c oxidase subunit 3 [Gammaproteobacteria bacterium]|nr:cytochrome c oxidase subunit 3 [Gammaproteobacteria bacterium]